MKFICLWGLSSFDSICPEKGASFVATATADKEDLERGWSTDPKTCTADRQVTLSETSSSPIPKGNDRLPTIQPSSFRCKLLVSRKGKSLLLNSDCDGKPQQMARPQVSGCCFSNSFCKMIIAVFEEDQTKRALDFTFLMKVRWQKRWPMANTSAHRVSVYVIDNTIVIVLRLLLWLHRQVFLKHICRALCSTLEPVRMAGLLAADPYQRSLCLLEFGSTAFFWRKPVWLRYW